MYDASLPYSKDPHFLNAVIDTLEEGIVVQSDQGKIVGFNDKALSLLAVSADQLMGDSSNSERWTAIDLDENIIPTENHPIVLHSELNNRSTMLSWVLRREIISSNGFLLTLE